MNLPEMTPAKIEDQSGHLFHSRIAELITLTEFKVEGFEGCAHE
jgi:hypothetical protein